MTNMHNFTRGAALNPHIAAAQLAMLDDQAIARIAPSVFAERAHTSRSDRYAYVPTFRVLEALRANGFVVRKAEQSTARLADRYTYTKHMLTLTHRDVSLAKVGDSIPQICLVNSHDGSSAYRVFAGLFRFVCSNGLIVCDGEFDAISVPHVGDIRGRVIEGSFEVIEAAKQAGERVADWQQTMLAPAEAEAFATAAIEIRYDTEKQAAPVTAAQLLKARRKDDEGADLWTTFNRVQENLIGGGQTYRRNGRRQTARPIKAIDGKTSANRALWKLADQMRQIKAAA